MGRQRGPSVALTAADLEACWKDLGGDAKDGFRAVGRLTAAPDKAVALLRERLKPAPMADVERLDRLIADLDSREFKVRELAGHVRQLRDENQTLRRQLAESQSELAALNERVNAATRRLDTLIEELPGELRGNGH